MSMWSGGGAALSESSSANLASAKTIITTLGSVATALVVAQTVARDLVPEQVQYYLSSSIYSVFRRFSSQISLVIDEFHGMESNHIYESAAFYLGAKTRVDAANSSSSSSSSSTRRLKLSKLKTEDGIYVDIDKDEEIVDVFDGVQFRWILQVSRRQRSYDEQLYYYHHPSDVRSEVRNLEVSFHKRYKKKAIEQYLPYIVDRARVMKDEIKTIKIYTTSPTSIQEGYGDVWEGVKLNHPATFETLAMDPAQKNQVMADLERFVKRREYYRRVGKAWKRGYLLYGPPGTGKSSLIAAMANCLRFDVYDLELTALSSNSDLRKVLVATANRSILVIEDIDCSIDLLNREGHRADDDNQDDDRTSGSSSSTTTTTGNGELGSKLKTKQQAVTLSGILNFIDGLWSSCGDERIIVFTTNYKEKLEPALLRPGRMDLQIHMSYLTPGGFDTLAKNYLNISSQSHPVFFAQIKRLIGSVQVSPAAVAEQLMKSDDAGTALTGLIHFLNNKKSLDFNAQAQQLCPSTVASSTNRKK